MVLDKTPTAINAACTMRGSRYARASPPMCLRR